MTIIEPMDKKNPPDNLICRRCNTSLPLHTKFCVACGEPIKKRNQEGEARTENGVDVAQVDTVHIPLLSRAQWEGLQSDQSLKDHGMTRRIHKGSLQPQEAEAPISEELASPSLPVPDIDTQKHSAIPLSQHWEQQITHPLSLVHAARQQIYDILGSNSSSKGGSDAFVESAKDVGGMKLTGDKTLKLSALSNNNSAVTGSLSKTWGWLPALSLTSAIGVFIVALACNEGRFSSQGAESLLWCGMLVFFLPITWRLLSARPTRRERVALLIVLWIALYLTKFLQYPLYFAGYDEFLHMRTAQDIAASGHLFRENPLLPISAYYPGLEIVTTALSSLTGLSPFVSGVVVIGLAQLLLVLSLYLLYEHLSNSARMAGIATLLYMTNINFIFFDGAFSYESLALPLAVFVVFAVAHRSNLPAGQRRGLTLAIWLGMGAVVVTHHITSYALVAFLLLWTMISFLLNRINRAQKGRAGPGRVALLGLVLSIAWLTYTGDIAVGYILPHIDSAVRQFLQILASERSPRQLFQPSAGLVVPLWQRIVSYVSVSFILLGLPFGLFHIWRHHRTKSVALAMACAALFYPVSQAFRLTDAGGEAAERSTEFLFVGIAIVLAIGAVEFWLSRGPSWRRSAMITGAVGVIFLGQLMAGTLPVWDRVPGPYLVSADDRSIEPEGVTAAEWARLYLGPGQRIASDRINTLLMATYGNEQVVTAENAPLAESPVFTLLRFGPDVVEILKEDKVEYLVVDHRLSTGLPLTGTYFNKPPSGEVQTKPIDPAALAKFDGVQNVSRVFDSGDIVIYNVEAITGGASTTPRPKSSCTPATSTAVSGSYPHVAGLYTGTISDVPTGLTTNIALTGIQQQQGTICGYFGVMPANALFNGIPTNSPFIGTVTSDKKIQFTITNDTGQATFSFEGVILPEGRLAGTYCNVGVVTGQCGDYGLWSVSPPGL